MKSNQCQFFYDWLEQVKSHSSKYVEELINSIIQVAMDEWDKCFDHEDGISRDEFIQRINGYRPHKGMRSGEDHWNWKGGITSENQKERNSAKYSEWRKNVFVRDNFTCQICGQVGGNLNAHHIKRWSTNVNERYDVCNGITLCKKCHADVHKKAVI